MRARTRWPVGGLLSAMAPYVTALVRQLTVLARCVDGMRRARVRTCGACRSGSHRVARRDGERPRGRIQGVRARRTGDSLRRAGRRIPVVRELVGGGRATEADWGPHLTTLFPGGASAPQRGRRHVRVAVGGCGAARMVRGASAFSSSGSRTIARPPRRRPRSSVAPPGAARAGRLNSGSAIRRSVARPPSSTVARWKGRPGSANTSSAVAIASGQRNSADAMCCLGCGRSTRKRPRLAAAATRRRHDARLGETQATAPAEPVAALSAVGGLETVRDGRRRWTTSRWTWHPASAWH